MENLFDFIRAALPWVAVDLLLAAFFAKGALPESLQDLNTQVWQEWYPNERRKYKGNGNAMLEVYSPGDMKSPDYECGIWVPICKREEEPDELLKSFRLVW